MTDSPYISISDSTASDGRRRIHLFWSKPEDPNNWSVIMTPAPDGEVIPALGALLREGWLEHGRALPNPIIDPLQGIINHGFRLNRDGVELTIFRSFRLNNPVKGLNPIEIVESVREWLLVRNAA